ncbi:MAG: hypothetical protein J6Z00_04120 [Clostridia bacterium]|nr:hypothetical protein [Clostridia bacterium]
MKEKMSIALEAIKRFFSNTQAWIVIIGIGVWIIVMQNFSLISSVGFERVQKVRVVGGYIDADVSGSVDVDNTVDVNVEGGKLDVSGSYVNVW